MSLDVYLSTNWCERCERGDEVFTANITHNLGDMAKEAGIYRHLWRPDELGITKAGDLVLDLTVGLSDLLKNPDKYRKLNPENGWGSYEGLVRFTRDYLEACREYPDARVRVWR